MKLPPLLPWFSLLATPLAGCFLDRSIELGSLPRPTEHFQDEEAEERNAQARKEWFKLMHRTAPDTNWRDLERQNGLAQMEKRRVLGTDRADGGRWTERGSQNQAGRIRAMARSPSGDTLYAGADYGGVWRASLSGSGWTPLGDNLYGGADQLVALPGTTADILLRTFGATVHRTLDQGKTWTVPGGLPSLTDTGTMLSPSGNTSAVYLVAQSHPVDVDIRRLMRSTDKGATFTEVSGLGGDVFDIWTSRVATGPLYVLTSTGLYTGSGAGPWTKVGDLPAAASGGALTGSEAGAPRLWAVLNTPAYALYRSDDGGKTWLSQGEITDYYGDIEASITDKNIFAYGGVEVWVTTNGGTSFAVVNTWDAYYEDPANLLHADVWSLQALPTPNGEMWYISSDGGLYHSPTHLQSVQNLSLTGLRIGQYYSTHTSTNNPARILAGAQDQGYQRSDENAASTGDLVDFEQLVSGDYGHLTSSDGSQQYVYSTYPGLILIQVGEVNPSLYYAPLPPKESYAWIPPVVADPTDPKSFFFLGRKLYRYTKRSGQNWWASSVWTKQSFGDKAWEFLSAMDFSPLDSNRAYMVTSAGKLYTTNDHAKTWTSAQVTGPGAYWIYGTALHASESAKDIAYVAGSGYDNPAVYRTTDGGKTWTPFGEGLPPTLAYCLTESADGTLFLGTETAAYSRAPGAPTWTDITSNVAPIVPYFSCEYVEGGGVIRFGTYARGIWDYAVE